MHIRAQLSFFQYTEVYGVCAFATAACLGHASFERNVSTLLNALSGACNSQANLPAHATAQASTYATTGAAADAGCMTEQTAADKLTNSWQHTQQTDLCWQRFPHVGWSLQR